MGLLDKLTQNGTPYSYGNGQTPNTNQGATRQSKLHTDGSTPGYSVDGSDVSDVNTAFQQYNDGVNNILPQPSLLDPNQPPIKYTDNLPH
jgi:hypothetical protein